MDQDGHASEEMEQRRTAATQAIVKSDAAKRLIVSGPGTGKSFTFQEALRSAGGGGLALTFIRNLVADLEKDLAGLADVFTFHGFCKHLMHSHDVAGLQRGDYYPPLMEVVVEDLELLGAQSTSEREIERRLHTLDTSEGLVDAVLERADYYEAVSHTDLVYRVLGHFEAVPDAIPFYPLVVVDEYQDFSLLETTFIALLATKNSTLIAGDDDQSLYKQLKHASPNFIRDLAVEGEYEVFELPFCSRCTSVIVAAVNDLVATAVAGGYLEGRLNKSFECYTPDKGADSAAHPKIIHARCSTANQPYPGRYVAQQIGRIPQEDIERSRAKGYPTALVIGPNPFLKKVYDEVVKVYPDARMKSNVQGGLDVLDGYRRIAADEESRLGWRIVVATRPFPGCHDAVRDALKQDASIGRCLPDEYRVHHLELAKLIGLLGAGQELAEQDAARLVNAVERSLPEIREFLGVEDDVEEQPTLDGDLEEPDILFTSLVGAKGLSAEHVFIVGFNDGHLPRKVDAITDEEICCLLVGLSRTRKQCHLVSAGFFGAGPLKQSVFLLPLKPHTTTVKVDKDYDFSV
jgi:hypothetical protein